MPAARAGLRFADAILAIDGAPIATLADVDAALAGKSRVVLAIDRRGEELEVAVTLDTED